MVLMVVCCALPAPAVSLAKVRILAADHAGTSIQAQAEVTDDGGSPISVYGFLYGARPYPDRQNGGASYEVGSGVGPFTATLPLSLLGLDAHAQQWYVRAFAMNAAGMSFSEHRLVTITPATTTLPIVVTAPLRTPTQGVIVAGGDVIDTGAGPVLERGVVIATHPEPTLEDMSAIAETGTGLFSLQLFGLLPDITYYARAYAVNAYGTSYGNVVTYLTGEDVIGLPVVTTSALVTLANMTASVGGDVSDPSQSIIQRGVVYATSAEPTVASGFKVTATAAVGPFTVELTDLHGQTTYHVRAFAINPAGCSYGAEVSFTTPFVQVVQPSVATTFTSSSVGMESAMIIGTITDDGGGYIMEHGVVYARVETPADEHRIQTFPAADQPVRAFSAVLTGLRPGTNYVARAYARNTAGVGWGESVSFTTKDGVGGVEFPRPTIGTLPPTTVCAESAVLDAMVLEYPGNLLTRDHTIQYWREGTLPIDKKTATNLFKEIDLVGPYSIWIDKLQPETTYMARARVSYDSQTHVYGNVVTFTTPPQSWTVPEVSTIAVTDIMGLTAIVSGELLDPGDSRVIERGVVFSSVWLEPTIEYGLRMPSHDTGTRQFRTELTGLKPQTEYRARAYAINSAGAAYGTVYTFTSGRQYTRLRVVAASAGHGHSLILAADGSLWGMGDNYWGQLGDGTVIDRLKPKKIVDAEIIGISAGFDTSFLITRDGRLWGTGHNDGYQIYPYDRVSYITRYILVAQNARQASAPRSKVHYIDTDGILWARGDNQHGNLGDGTDELRMEFVRIADGVRSVSVSALGANYICDDGSLWSTFSTERPTGSLLPAKIADDILAVARGYTHRFRVLADGSLWGRGDNSSGQLGDGTTESPGQFIRVAEDVRAVGAGHGFSMFIKNDDSLWAMGGEVGRVDIYNGGCLPVKIADSVSSLSMAPFGTSAALFVKRDGSLWKMAYVDGHTVPMPVIESAAFSGIEFAGARKRADWFGWYDDATWPWIWDCERARWLWVFDRGPTDVWLWSPAEGCWSWTGTGVFPWRWFPAEGTWDY